MESITLNTGAAMPLIGFGTWRIWGADCERCVSDALECGYRLIDTAASYENEKETGAAIAKSGLPRSELFVVTKVWFKDSNRSYDAALECLDRLGMDYADLLLVHWPLGDYYAAWRGLLRVAEQKRARAIGVSNFSAGRLLNLIHQSPIVPAANQLETHLECLQQDCARVMKKYNVAHMAYAPLGRFRPELAEAPEVLALAQKYNRPAAQILLRYLMDQGICVIPKSLHKERIVANWGATQFHLAQDEVNTLKALDKNRPVIGMPEDPEKIASILGMEI